MSAFYCFFVSVKFRLGFRLIKFFCFLSFFTFGTPHFLQACFIEGTLSDKYTSNRLIGRQETVNAANRIVDRLLNVLVRQLVFVELFFDRSLIGYNGCGNAFLRSVVVSEDQGFQHKRIAVQIVFDLLRLRFCCVR